MSVLGTFTGGTLTATGTNILVNGALTINAGSGGATITGSSSTAAGITSNTSQNITASGNVTFVGISTAGSFVDGISLAGTYTDNSGTLTFDGTAAASGAYGIECGVSGSWAGSISVFGNVVFKGTGGTTRTSDLNVGPVTGNGNVTLVGRLKGLNSVATFTSTNSLPLNVSLQTTAGGIGGLLNSGTDNTGNGSYTINAAGAVTLSGRIINAGTGAISLTSGTGYSVTGNISLTGETT